MSRLPVAARAIGNAVTLTVQAVTAQDAVLFAEHSERLAALDQERVRLVMGGLLSTLLEARMPEGLAADDLRQGLEQTVRRSVTWFPAIDVAAFILVLTDALGVQREEDDEDGPLEFSHLVVIQHGALLIADLLATPEELTEHLARSFAEIERDQTVELP